jgi:signal peptidase I
LASKSTKNLIKDVVIIVVAIAIIWLGLQAVFGTANPFYVVSSGSMIPALEIYDVIVVEGNTPFEDIEKGDIIVFYSPKLYEQGKERVIVHRVSLLMGDDPKIVRTRGDANPSSIAGTDYPITEKEYLGKVEYVVPQVGYITQILQPPINYIIIAVIIGVMVVKHFADKEKKKIEFQYRNDESVDDDSDNVVKNEKDSEYTKSSDIDESVDDDSDNVVKNEKDSEYTKSSDIDESVDGDKKEL